MVTRLADAEEGQVLEGTFAVREARLMSFKNRPGNYLQLVLADPSGVMTAKVWNDAEPLHARLAPGAVVRVQGKVQAYQNTLQLVVDQVEVCPAGSYAPEDFLPVSPRPLDEMKDELRSRVNGLQQPALRRLVRAFALDAKLFQAFCRAPAAMVHHHAYLGGLLEHTLNVMKLAQGIAAGYPEVDADLLLAGALFHDIGKVKEYSWGTTIQYTDQGRLLGHIVMGVQVLDSLLARVPEFPERLRLHLLHMVVSHHGEYEWQSPKRPKFLEAYILHRADLLDADIDKFVQAKREHGGKAWSGYIKGLDRVVYLGAGRQQAAEAEEEP